MMKAALAEKEKTADSDDPNSFVKKQKKIVPLNYLGNFWSSLETPLFNWKVYLELNWMEDCILLRAGNSAKLKITEAKLHVPKVTLSTKDNVNGTIIKLFLQK